MEVKFKKKEIIVKNFLTRTKAEAFATPCPHGRTTFLRESRVMAGSIACMNCKYNGGIDYDAMIVHCKKEKPKKTNDRKTKANSKS